MKDKYLGTESMKILPKMYNLNYIKGLMELYLCTEKYQNIRPKIYKLNYTKKENNLYKCTRRYKRTNKIKLYGLVFRY